MKVCLGPSSASTAIWWCHTVRTQVGLLEPLPSRFMEGVDHRITHLHRSFQLQLRGCGLYTSSPGSRGRHVGSASRRPRSPPWPPDGCPCLGTRAQPPWELLEGAQLVNTNTRADTPSRTGKPEIKEPSWNLQHCMDFILFPACGWGWQSRSRGARFPTHRTLEKEMS